MIEDYVRTKIRDALIATDNNKHDAQKLLITWAVRDQGLLLGMAKPHLKAISASLIEHMIKSKDKETGDGGPDSFEPKSINEIISSGGLPKDRRAPKNLPPPKSTERQATTMRKLAAAFTRKKK